MYSIIAERTHRSISLGLLSRKTHENHLLVPFIGSKVWYGKDGFNATTIIVIRFSKQELACVIAMTTAVIGTGGNPDNTITCSNEARKSPDGNKRVQAIGYILIQRPALAAA